MEWSMATAAGCGGWKRRTVERWSLQGLEQGNRVAMTNDDLPLSFSALRLPKLDIDNNLTCTWCTPTCPASVSSAYIILITDLRNN